MVAHPFLHPSHQRVAQQQKTLPEILPETLSGVPFLDNRRSATPLRPVLVGADSAPALETAVQACQRGVAEALLVGDARAIRDLARQRGWDIGGLEIVPVSTEAELMPAAIRAIHRGQADSLIKGQIHTDLYMRGILAHESGLRPAQGNRMVHVFALFPRGEGRPLLISDAAVNVAPNQLTLQQSLISSVMLAQRLGIERPRVAVLSATESVVESVPSSVQAAALVEWARAQDLTAQFAGPLALDGAIAPAAAAIKGIDDPVAGRADVIIVPDIVSGNVLFKSLVWFAGAVAAGVVLGARVPVVLTSRADPAEARLASVMLAGLMRGA